MRIVFLLTAKELYRKSYIWYINLFAILACEILPAFELFAFGKTEIATLDILQATLFFTMLICLLISSYQLLGRELHERMALTLFTKPISPFCVILGKVLALLSILFIISLIQGLCILKQGWYLDWPNEIFRYTILSIWTVFLQGVMVLSLSTVLSICFGSIIGAIGPLIIIMTSYIVPAKILVWLSPIIPAMPWFDLSSIFYSGEQIMPVFILSLSAYGIMYALWMLFLGGLGLKIKEF